MAASSLLRLGRDGGGGVDLAAHGLDHRAGLGRGQGGRPDQFVGQALGAPGFPGQHPRLVDRIGSAGPDEPHRRQRHQGQHAERDRIEFERPAAALIAIDEGHQPAGPEHQVAAAARR